MFTKIFYKSIGVLCIVLIVSACKNLAVVQKTANANLAESYATSIDTANSANLSWKQFFTDPNLMALIDTALKNNQELNMTLQEIEISKNEIRARKGEYLPFVGLGGAAGVDKVGRYTSHGASEATTDIEPGRKMPEPVPDFGVAAIASWEIDIWRKLRNAKASSVARYLASVDGKNFMVTQLVSEIANSYYELLALDNQLQIVQQNIAIQSNALEIVKMQKASAQVTELAVRKFEAQVLSTKSLQFEINQQIIEAENRINFLVGRFPQPVPRNGKVLLELSPNQIAEGIPSQLLENRPDIRQAEQELVASKLDVKVARANFYPSLSISAALGLQAFNPTYLVKAPESILYSLAGDLASPLINRNAIKATYNSANAKQLQAIYNYERTVLNAYIEVENQLSNISNLESSYNLKSQQVQTLTESINISNKLFTSARANYIEVLLTQRDALESKFELIETRQKQMSATVSVYRALGGGWH